MTRSVVKCPTPSVLYVLDLVPARRFLCQKTTLRVFFKLKKKERECCRMIRVEIHQK